MIVAKLRLLMAQRGVRYIKDLAAATGIGADTLGRFADGRTQRFDAPVLDALCAHFGCQPGDLLEYVADAPTVEAATAQSTEEGR